MPSRLPSRCALSARKTGHCLAVLREPNTRHMEALLGLKLLHGDEEISSGDHLRGKVVGLYFSAHWCPPCRGFTPILAEKYKALLEAGKGFEVVFISSDHEEASFNEYRSEMPWVALPYANRDLKASLSKRFKVSGIPTLVILDEQGALITEGGRGAITDPGFIEAFPWTPPTLEACLASLVDVKGEPLALKSLQESGKHIALYFSAHWCPPCRGFTPELAKKYTELRAAGERLEIVFISSDRDEASFNEYRSEMPWAALPYANRSAKAALSERYKVAGIPSLILLDPALNVVHPNARSAVTSDQPFPWTPKLVTDIDDDAEGINDTPSIIALLQAVPDAARSAAVAVLEAAAAANKQLVGRGAVCGIDGVCLPAADPVLFFTATDPSPESLASRVRNLFGCGEPSAEPIMVLADLGSGGKFHRHTGPVTEETIRTLLADFRSGSLNEMETLGDDGDGDDD